MVKILYFLTCLGFLYANDFQHSIKVNNQNPYQNEGVLLEVNLTQTDHSKVMFFKFRPKKSLNYSFYEVGFKEHENYHELKQYRNYLVYPNVAGEVNIEFEFIKSVTSDEKVAYAISGDRDSVKQVEKEDIKVELKPLKLKVKALPENTIVGDFKLSYSVDKNTTSSYDPIHLKIILKGKGNLNAFDFLPNGQAYHLFSQTPKLKTLRSPAGTSSSLEWDYALSAKSSFVLPKVVLKAFNPKNEQAYDLLMPKQQIEVQEVQEKALLDKTETPRHYQSTDWSWVGTFFSYFIVFVAGLLMPRELLKKRKQKVSSLKEKIEKAKTHRELLKLLLAQNTQVYEEAIGDLEQVLYNGAKISLTDIKQRRELTCKTK